jgi:arylsulfotransferase ASST
MKTSLAIGLAIVCCAACGDGLTPGAASRPAISGVVVAGNHNNVLSATVTFSSTGADSARVRYLGRAGDTGSTPFVRTRAGLTRVVVLGLRPSARYSLAIEAAGGGGATTVTDSIATEPLPAAIESLRLRGSGGPSSAFTLAVPILSDTSAGADGYIVVFDSVGDLRWYHRFPGLWPVEAKQQPNGNLTVYVGRSYGWQPVGGHFEELAADGAVVRTYGAPDPYFTDPHELVLSFTDTVVTAAHLLSYQLQRFDLSAVGGAKDALLAAHSIERHDAAGATVFRWRSLDHFTAQDFAAGAPPIPDIDHPSSLSLDRDGNYIVSFQGLNEITDIDANTGAIRWRLGGRNNQFQIVADSLGGFSGQHNVQMLQNGHLLLMDNHIRTRGPARAVEYALDTQAMTATLVWEYRPSPGVISMSMGSVQRLANGSTLVGFGAAGRVAEVAGDMVTWSATLAADEGGSPIPFYRAVALRSLWGLVPAARR